MNNIDLEILGSPPFLNIFNELDFNNTLNPKYKLGNSSKKVVVKVLFVDNLKIKEVKNYITKNEPIILFLKNKDYIKKKLFTVIRFSH
jgi:hypothetical protein